MLDQLVLSREYMEEVSEANDWENEIRDLREEANNWESLTIELSEKLDELECELDELQQFKHKIEDKEWSDKLDELQRGSEPLAARSKVKQCG